MYRVGPADPDRRCIRFHRAPPAALDRPSAPADRGVRGLPDHLSSPADLPHLSPPAAPAAPLDHDRLCLHSDPMHRADPVAPAGRAATPHSALRDWHRVNTRGSAVARFVGQSGVDRLTPQQLQASETTPSRGR